MAKRANISTASQDAPASAASGKASKKRRVSLSSVLIAIVLLAGIGIVSYPAVSDWWNSQHATRAIESYQAAVDEMTDAEREQFFAQAEQYNEHLSQLSDPFGRSSELEQEYQAALNVTGGGLIGYVTVDKIDVKLPIYHGTEDGTLQTAAGHLEGSHLPIGGEGRHAVISAHRGLPSAMLFTRLDELVEGDYFSVTVLDQELFYQVDQIRIVEPAHIDDLLPVEGLDCVTLQTCTPYGVNSHRLLVRGHRVDGIPSDLALGQDAKRVPVYIAAPAIAVPLLLIALIALLIATRRKSTPSTDASLAALSELVGAGHLGDLDEPGGAAGLGDSRGLRGPGGSSALGDSRGPGDGSGALGDGLDGGPSDDVTGDDPLDAHSEARRTHYDS